MLPMTTENRPNNVRLRELIEKAGLTQARARHLFNLDQLRPISESTWKAWLADRESARWRPVSDAYLERAEKVFTTTKR